ncbi:hypothetical protein TeGR_g4020 [Tetraparma gracilis]|uniref:Uncharacterized protein n=1 Tax=Tetraparma gracilis TaxID=2962635 RepID=A0ABQ6MWX3_9STRA|nr:hypothetical protein TeGR_g4020 [Tetraparma gracilis]
MNPKEGRALGSSLLACLPASDEEELLPLVSELLRGTEALKQFLIANETFPVLVTYGLLQEKRLLSDTVITSASDLSEEEACKIGKSLSAKLATTKLGPKAAVNKWIRQYPALLEFDKLDWFRPCMETVAVGLVGLQGGFSGASLRLILNAGVSILDQFSDFYMLHQYSTTGQQGTAVSLGIMVGLNMSTQLGIVYMQTRKGRGWKRRMLLEMLIVVTAIKPGVDAWRVARGDEQHKHSAVDPETELAFSRASEMVFESIPGCILQTRAILQSIAVDFAGIIQLRAPGEMGGAWWTFTMVIALSTSFVATHIYYTSLEDPTDAALPPVYSWTIVGALSSAYLAVFVVFLCLINPGYTHTFFSTTTGASWATQRFTEANNDETRAKIMSRNKKIWPSIRDDVKAWTLENWEHWEDEEPEWFNSAWKASVDDDMIPPDCLRRLSGASERHTKNSLANVRGGAGEGKVVPVSGSSKQYK